MKKILVVGGDYRQIILAEEFKKSGYPVKIAGFDSEYVDNGITSSQSLKNAVKESDIIIFGLPALKDEKTVNTPLYSSLISIDDIIPLIDKGKIIMGGMLKEELITKLKTACAGIYDYFNREELIIKNVIPTVEGAIAIAINETAVTLHNSRCLVIGYGRIGKYLSGKLSGLGADVTVSARKNEDYAWIALNGMKAIRTNELNKYLSSFDIIFNTVPHMVLNSDNIDCIKSDSVIIDLASKPGGCDINYAKYKGIKTIWALSLPGKTAPVTAGRIIKETIENIINELGV